MHGDRYINWDGHEQYTLFDGIHDYVYEEGENEE
ncbi:hypothetical protein FGG36_gp44 [Mycobacterium phage Jeffabunny]|uniref:Uncharacterized protein n=8 Tax=Gladiatorvirus TaxID=2948726 RepID=A0A1C9LYV3_9CAUD|nr:hypothetical protein X820_gp055 [Mycobacterium phage CloudWang3]YP_008858484.1 hypothetical protein X828_gp054 [Mycobacterium phage Artemis2UCLA]YP_008859167.1 hypothetical protein X821_gp053 [Mycobacterium phage Zaka]YP_009014549.1 hypothetical protein CL99_gp054 [Mycobacterium phage Blue7]YP_009635551.1 hypothetical protein FGG54_gp51 [Mycobacterium phage Gladiator]YP_009636575.1 hypothetical protein FGG22_gp056 [Mycobacterium phage Hammer]YP_009638231.1 hypothetical protein FGG36_gp44 [